MPIPRGPGTLVYAGAFFVQTYGLSTAPTGLLLAGAAATYVPAPFVFRRWIDRRAYEMLIGLATVSSLALAAFGAFRATAATSFVLLAILAFLAGARTMAGSVVGLRTAPDNKLAVMALRAAGVQLGYFIGSAVGGMALAWRGYGALGVALAGLYLAAAAVLFVRRRHWSVLRFTDEPAHVEWCS